MTAENKDTRGAAARGTEIRGASPSAIQLALWPTVTLFVGLLLLYIGERVADAKSRAFVDGVGALLALAAIGGRAAQAMKAKDAAHRSAERWLLLAKALVVAGVGLYFAFDLFENPLKESLGKSYERVSGIAAVLWPSLVVLAGLPLINMQRALQSMTDGHGGAEHVELQRVRYSAQSGLTVGMVVMFCFAVCYVAADRNKKYDLARFRSTRPSPSTKKLVENLNKRMQATLFFQNPNEVREQVVPYFEELEKLGSRLKVEVLDHALSPARAKELSATGNGVLVLAVVDDQGKVTQRESLFLGTTLEAAGTALGTFDGDVQKRLLTLTRPGRMAYFTVGHGERSFDPTPIDLTKDDLRAGIADLRELLSRQGFDIRTLGAGQGLLNKIPGDAGVVFIVGPTEHFQPEEINTLKAFLNDGGRVYLFLDPSSDIANKDLAELLKVAGLKYNGQVLCNSEMFAPRTHKAADHANIAITGFSSHVSVTTLSRVSGRAAVIAPRAGWLERDGAAPASGVNVDFTLRTMPNTWADNNGNFTYESGERRMIYDVGAAVTKPVADSKDKREMRLAVFGSVDGVSDMVLRNQANLVMVLDTLKWLMGDEAIVADVVQESDAPIVHTNAQDKLWFYSTIFAAPLLLVVGAILTTRRGQRRRAS